MQEDTPILEEFEHVREHAIGLTDAYLARPAADPLRGAL